jgi:excinuclease ABC subunit C
MRTTVARLPSAPGVYRFRDSGGRVLYVGRAVNLRRRVESYRSNLGDRQHLRPMVSRIARVEAAVCDSEHEAAWLERNLLERHLPRWNRTPGGAEVPVYIRLDPRPGAPGLTVVHIGQLVAGARLFGPYLGGLKVRLAVSALDRVLPLAYAGERLGGFQRDMARVRGVDAAGRETLIRRLTAVLEKEPTEVAALRDELAHRRDGAAAALAFELAARLQAEIEALDWVVAEQKATLAEPRDVDVYGWASGVLVHFEVRGGRLCRWTQRACTGAAARNRVAATPAEWVPFAQRNAALAAALR